MAEPTGGAAALTAAGFTVLGVATGLDPDVLLAGLAGGWWVQTLADPIPVGRRLMLALLSALLAGWSATPAAALLSALALRMVDVQIPAEALKYVGAIAVGFAAHRIIGPWLLRFGTRQVEEAGK